MDQRAESGRHAAEGGLAVRFLWGERCVAAYTLRAGEPRRLDVGSGADVDFALASDEVGERFTLATSAAGRLRCAVPVGATGHFERAGVGAMSLAEARRLGLVEGDGALTLRRGDRLVLGLGALRAEARWVRAPRRVVTTPPWDFRWLNALLGTAAVALFVVLSWVNAASSGGPLEDDEPARVWLQVRPTLIAPPPPPERRRSVSRDPAAEVAPKRSRSPAPVSHARPSVGAAQGVAALRRLLSGSVFAGGISLPLDDRALSRATAGITAVGPPGAGGVALRGDASGGGRETLIGLGGLGRPGALPGAGGREPVLRKDSPPTLAPDFGPIAVTGYDRDLIRSVIHAHRSELKYCYEVRLSRSPSLAGRVAVRFTVGATGLVTSAAVSDSSVADLELEACLLGRVRTWQFPAPKGGAEAVVTYPFVFARPGR